MAQTDWLLRRQPWVLWIIVGTIAGALVVGLLGAVVGVVDRVVYGSYEPDPMSLPLLYASIGGGYGAVGGLMASALCAATIAAVRRRSSVSESTYGAIAAVITAGLSAIFGLWFGLADVSRASEVLLWFVMPVSVVTAVAYVIGARIWRWTLPGQRGSGG